jgi:hypothetical protein
MRFSPTILRVAQDTAAFVAVVAFIAVACNAGAVASAFVTALRLGMPS